MDIKHIGNNIYKVSGEISIFYISDFYESLKKLINKDKVYLDLSDVTSIDTSGVQVILSFKKTGIKYKKDFRIIRPSNEIKKTLKILGVM
jgi:anti-sigma B factor antagonist